jgi:hypothetical protein
MDGKLQALREMAQILPANEQWKPRTMQAIQYGFGAFN